MIRLALPKGRLLAGLVPLLERAGMRLEIPDARRYRVTCDDPRIEAQLIKARAIPQMVALGNFPLGFCGRDLVRDADYERVRILFDTGLNPVRIVAAVPTGTEWILTNPPPRPIVIASEYRGLAERWAFDRGLAAIVIETHGATEGYAPGIADLVIDCVETGATMGANGLAVIETVVQSSTCLVGNEEAIDSIDGRPFVNELINNLKRTLEES